MEVDPNWSDYRIELTAGWVKATEALLPRRSRLQAAFWDLLADLRASSHAASLPYMLTANIVSFHRGHIKGREDRSHNFRLADAMTRRLALKLQGKLDAAMMATVRGACLEIQQEFVDAYDSAPAISHEEVWGGFSDFTPFRTMAWSAQRNAFVMSWAAFENFLLQAVAAALMNPTFKRRLGQGRFTELADEFDEAIHGICWADDYPTHVRLARDAIMHNGGRVGSPLDQLPHPFAVIEKLLQIKASDNRNLLKYIENCTLALITAANEKPALLQPKRPRKRHRRKS